MNEKHKVAVVAALGVLVLGIGAFQFANLGNSEPPKPKPEETKDAVAADATTETPPDPMAGLFALNMKPRDPFQEESLPQIEGTTPPAQPTPPPTNPGPRVRPPRPLGGDINPWDPGAPPLPGANGAGGNLNPSAPLVNPDEPTFRFNGVILGTRPAAVMVDGSGNQRLVTVGGSLDGDSQLVGVEKGKVTVRRKGKTLTYNVGGTPDAK